MILWTNIIDIEAKNIQNSLNLILLKIFHINIQLLIIFKFFTRLISKDQSRWESIILSKSGNSVVTGNDVYIWKRGNNGLLPLDQDQWRNEIINAAARCAREGDPVHASISFHLLHTVASKQLSKLT